jgi:flagellar biosynthetic protein FliO
MSSAPDVASTALQMLTALGIVLGGLFFIVYLMKRFLKRDAAGTKKQLIKIVASQYIGIKKNIALVEVPGAILVVGVTNESISLLTKIEDKMVVDGIRKETSRLTPSFVDQLQRLTDKVKNGRNSK